MSASRLWLALRRNVGLLTLSILLLALWFALERAAGIRPTQAPAAERTTQVLLREMTARLRPDDLVFLSSSSASLRSAAEGAGAILYAVEASQPRDMDSSVQEVLDGRCEPGPEGSRQIIYWIWDEDQDHSPPQLGEAARQLAFVFRFQAVLSHRGDDLLAIDRLLRLVPKDKIIRTYCEAIRVSGSGPVLVILDQSLFSPWIGAVSIGNVTWLSSTPKRVMVPEDFAVKDMPPFLVYDVFWMAQVPERPTWDFVHQDTLAYTVAVRRIMESHGMILVDRGTTLGSTASVHLRECVADEHPVESELFRQMCLR